MLANPLGENFVHIALVYSVRVSIWNAWLYCSASLLPWTLINQVHYLNIDCQIYRMKNSIRIKPKDHVFLLYVIAFISVFFIGRNFCVLLLSIDINHPFICIVPDMASQYQPSSLSFFFTTYSFANAENSTHMPSLSFDYVIM